MLPSLRSLLAPASHSGWLCSVIARKSSLAVSRAHLYVWSGVPEPSL